MIKETGLVTSDGWRMIVEVCLQESAEEKAMATRLVEFLVASVYHETRSIMRNNLEMLKTLLECWKGRIDLPYE